MYGVSVAAGWVLGRLPPLLPVDRLPLLLPVDRLPLLLPADWLYGHPPRLSGLDTAASPSIQNPFLGGGAPSTSATVCRAVWKRVAVSLRGVV